MGIKIPLGPGHTHLILTLHEKVQQFLGIDNGLPEVRHEPNQSRVPLVDDLPRIKK